LVDRGVVLTDGELTTFSSSKLSAAAASRLSWDQRGRH